MSVSKAARYDGPPPADYVRQQEVDQAAVYANMEKFFYSSSDYVSDQVPELMARIRDGMNLFPFNGEPLSLEEKKKYGLPTRSKIPSDVLRFYTPAGLKHWDRGMVSRVFMNYRFMIQRQRSLEDLERIECKYLKVLGCETYKGKLFPVSSPPPMPCDKCSKDVCNCNFVYGD